MAFEKIRFIREISGLGLREAKDVVDLMLPFDPHSPSEGVRVRRDIFVALFGRLMKESGCKLEEDECSGIYELLLKGEEARFSLGELARDIRARITREFSSTE